MLSRFDRSGLSCAEDIEILADMTAKLSNEVPAEAVEVVAEMTKELGPKLNRREVKMITKEANKQANINMTPRDVKIVSEIVTYEPLMIYIGQPPSEIKGITHK